VLAKLEWVSLGGGIFFTKKGYPVAEFCAKLKAFAKMHGVQVYLEPGEAAITGRAELVATVLDVVHNEVDTAILDAATEAHMLDLLLYSTPPHRQPGAGTARDHASPGAPAWRAMSSARTASRPGWPGSEVRIADVAGYTMVKKNWFNGVPMPSICVRRLDGTLETVKAFGYKDFKDSLS
jgi:carboxynorspermidine decarboxylase